MPKQDRPFGPARDRPIDFFVIAIVIAIAFIGLVLAATTQPPLRARKAGAMGYACGYVAAQAEQLRRRDIDVELPEPSECAELRAAAHAAGFNTEN